MDLHTFRRNGPGLAECASPAAWRRLWAGRRAHRSLDTRADRSLTWPHLGHNLDTEGKPRGIGTLRPRRCRDGGRTAKRCPRPGKDEIRESRHSVANRLAWPPL